MAEKTEREKAQRLVADNRKALHDYHILDTWEAGVALLGGEVKSIREGPMSAANGALPWIVFVRFVDGRLLAPLGGLLGMFMQVVLVKSADSSQDSRVS